MQTVAKSCRHVKVKAKVERFARLVHAPTADLPGHMVLTVGREVSDYTVERIDSQLGDAFRVTKCCPVEDGEEHTYHILLSHEGHACECKAWCRWQACRHVSALLALKGRGKL